VTLAHPEAKAYGSSFDLIYRRETLAPGADGFSLLVGTPPRVAVSFVGPERKAFL